MYLCNVRPAIGLYNTPHTHPLPHGFNSDLRLLHIISSWKNQRIRTIIISLLQTIDFAVVDEEIIGDQEVHVDLVKQIYAQLLPQVRRALMIRKCLYQLGELVHRATIAQFEEH